MSTDWQKNPQVALTKEQQREVTKYLCSYGGTSLATMDADGLCVGYIVPDVFKKAKSGSVLVGTMCGRKDNVLTPAMCDMLLAAQHVVGLLDKDSVGPGKKLSIAALAVRGMGRRDSKRMEKMAQKAGCSLRPDPEDICDEEWILFESE